MLEKKALSPELLEAQTAMELPDREMMALLVVVATDVVDIRNVDVSANLCANVLTVQSQVSCEAS